jgi:hypothetical protein
LVLYRLQRFQSDSGVLKEFTSFRMDLPIE